MVVINPPWTLETQMKEILPYLTKTLVQKVLEAGQSNGLHQSNSPL